MSAKTSISSFEEFLRDNSELELVGTYQDFSLKTEVELRCFCGTLFIRTAKLVWHKKVKSCGSFKENKKGTGALGTVSKYSFGDARQILAESGLSLIGDYDDSERIKGIKIWQFLKGVYGKRFWRPERSERQ